MTRRNLLLLCLLAAVLAAAVPSRAHVLPPLHPLFGLTHLTPSIPVAAAELAARAEPPPATDYSDQLQTLPLDQQMVDATLANYAHAFPDVTQEDIDALHEMMVEGHLPGGYEEDDEEDREDNQSVGGQLRRCILPDIRGVLKIFLARNFWLSAVGNPANVSAMIWLNYLTNTSSYVARYPGTPPVIGRAAISAQFGTLGPEIGWFIPSVNILSLDTSTPVIGSAKIDVINSEVDKTLHNLPTGTSRTMYYRGRTVFRDLHHYPFVEIPLIDEMVPSREVTEFFAACQFFCVNCAAGQVCPS